MRDILEEADDLKARMKEEGRWPPPVSHERQTVDGLMAKCPDNPSRDLLAAMLAQAYCTGKVAGAEECRIAVSAAFANRQ